MKRLIILPLMALALLPASAQKLIVTNTTVNCGRTGYEQPVTATFELRNKGKRRLVIESVKPDCGCTAVEFPKEVGAGDKFTIKMTYDARQLGHFHKMAAIKSNGTKTPVYLTMKGVVLADFRDYSGEYPYSFGDLLFDRSDLEFDDVNKGDAPVQEIHILNNGTTKMDPRLLHLPPYLSANIAPETLAPGRAGTITVTLDSEKLRDYGLTQTSVYLARFSGDKVSSENEISLSAILLPDTTTTFLSRFTTTTARPSMKLSTNKLDLGELGNKKKLKGSIFISNKGKKLLQLSAIQVFNNALEVSFPKREVAPGETIEMKVTLIAKYLPLSKAKPRVLIISDDPEHLKETIDIEFQ